MPAPFPLPIGLRLTQVSRAVERAFDEALGEAGGTLPVWLILLNLKVGNHASQKGLAEAVGVTEATLTHHLNAMDARGLITRTRDAANRRVRVVAMTEAGERCHQVTAHAGSIRSSRTERCGWSGRRCHQDAPGRPAVIVSPSSPSTTTLCPRRPPMTTLAGHYAEGLWLTVKIFANTTIILREAKILRESYALPDTQ